MKPIHINSLTCTGSVIALGQSNYMLKTHLAIHFQNVWLVANAESEFQGQVVQNVLPCML